MPLAAAALGAVLFLALRIVPTYVHRPWDFETYWYASAAAARGQNPYDPAVLARLAHRPVGMPFLYSPATLPLLMPLASLPLEAGARIWFGLKALLILPLVLLWQRRFLPGWNVAVVAAVAVLGFNAASTWDLRAGNVAIVEQLVLWIGFAAYASDRRRLFAACVVLASLFKLFPIVFLALLLVPSRTSPARWRLAGIAFAAFLLLAFAPTIAGFSWARDFLRNLPAERPWGLSNPSALGLIDTLLGDHTTPLTTPPYTALAWYAAYGVALVALSLPAITRLWRRRDPGEWVLASALLYALLVPRLMVYSYLLAIVPVLGLVGPIASRIGGPAILAGAVSAQGFFKPVLGWDYRDAWTQNFSFFLLLGFWLFYLAFAEEAGQNKTAGPPKGPGGKRSRRPKATGPRRTAP